MVETILGFVETILTFLHDLFEPLFGANSWGWAIIALTLAVRVALLPLAIKQTRSMRAMQAIQPQMKALQKKYKVDKELMRKDPEQYKAKKAKLNEEMMALYKEEGANPAASCLPLLAQAPIFIALFYTLRRMEELSEEGFYFFTQATQAAQENGLSTLVSEASWPGWLLIVLMSGTMFLSQKQMMARNAGQLADNPMAQQQKILLYVMPVFLAAISFQFPLGILLYWVTTNFWQVAQQAIILREVNAEAKAGELAEHPGGEAARKPRPGGGTSGKDDKDAPGPSRPTSPGASSGRSGGSASSGKRSGSSSPDDEAPGDDDGDDAQPDRASGDASGSSGAGGAGSEPLNGKSRPSSGSSKRDHLPRRGGNPKA